MSTLRCTIRIHREAGFTLDVDLQFPSGVTTAVLGPNGAGKSTLAGAITGSLPIDAGWVGIGDRAFDDGGATFVPPEERGVGVVFQDDLLFPHLSVLDNVAFGPRSRGASREAAREVARSWLDRVELGGLAEQRPGRLSGGQARRVALVRALASSPEVVVLDEPLAAVDVAARSAMRALLAEHLASFGGPRLLITHDPEEAYLLADVVYVLEAGTVTHHGTPDEIRLHPMTPYAADLAGVNLLRGVGDGGAVEVSGHQVVVATEPSTGPVLLTIPPTAIALHLERPVGSPRNVWRTTVEWVERLGVRARVRTGAPVPLTVEITEQSRAEMGVETDLEVWVSVKATEIGVRPDSG